MVSQRWQEASVISCWDYSFHFSNGTGNVWVYAITGLAPCIQHAGAVPAFLYGGGSHFRLIAACNTADKDCSGEILTTGSPSFVTEFSSGVIIPLRIYTILRLSGTTGVAAHGCDLQH